MSSLQDGELESLWHTFGHARRDLPLVEIDRNPELPGLLKLIRDALTASGQGGLRRVPSAGALFPYELLIASAAVEPAYLHVNLFERTCSRLPLSAQAAVNLSGLLGEGNGTQAERVVVLLRPWLSMRKYGPRGYLYAQLDAGHAATSLLGTARWRGPACLRLRLPRAEIQNHLAPHLPFREIHSVVSVNLTEKNEIAATPVLRSRTPSSAGATKLEQFAWNHVPDALHYATTPRGTPTQSPLVRGRLSALNQPWTSEIDWLQATERRHSARDFDPHLRPSVIEAFAGVLAHAGADLCTDLLPPGTNEDDVTITAIVDDDQLGTAIRASLVDCDIDVSQTPAMRDRSLISRVCMGQVHLAHARLLVLLHASRSHILDPINADGMRRALFRAAAGGHLMYLGAARRRIGITAVGAFDAEGLRELAGLSDDREILYLLAIGVESARATKTDRQESSATEGYIAAWDN